MALPDSYTVKPGSITAYFEAILGAEAPQRFSTRFLESLEFKSTNDRLFIGVMKDIGFIDTDGVPTQRYFDFLDRSQSAKIVGEGVREAYSDLFAVNKEAQKLSVEEVKNKLRTLYKGTKTDNVIGRIASTFVALCEYSDFSSPRVKVFEADTTTGAEKVAQQNKRSGFQEEKATDSSPISPSLTVDALQYHINIVLPESRDQATYDAIFKSLRDHLGRKNG